MEGSNLAILQRLFAGTEGVDVVPGLRAALRGETHGRATAAAARFAAWLEVFDSDVQIDVSAVEIPDIGVLGGPEGWRTLWNRWLEDWEHYAWSLRNWSEVGEQVIVDVEVRATGKASGATTIWTQCHVWTFRDGKVIRFRAFKNRASALAAIGTH